MGGYKLDLQPTSHTLFFTVTETQCGLRANKKATELATVDVSGLA